MGYYIWATAGHELGTLSMRLHNSLTVHDNFVNFKMSLVIAPSPPTPHPQHHYDTLHTKVDMWHTPDMKTLFLAMYFGRLRWALKYYFLLV